MIRNRQLLIGICIIFTAIVLYPAASFAQSGTVDVDTTLNVRQAPSTSAHIIGSLYPGDIVELQEVANNWGSITYKGETGYVSMHYVHMRASELAGKVIAIDAGHGGKDSGAIANGVLEKRVVLPIAKKTQAKLQAQGAEVMMTRSNDSYIELEDRANQANTAGADVFVSIHANAASATAASGTEVYYYPGSSSGYALAAAVQTGLLNQLGSHNRGVKSADFNVLRNTSMPAVLAEIGFLTNAPEAQKLASASYQEKAAAGLVQGIRDYTD
ncbi:N-acetylmuramoyl-L-alanine amidase [Terribacillus aidingensis]|uniref:N-acetylmuramoyl-L-alanine amidase n=1 Tax=Terribacillus aidingensis TaxID=586416 RepID=A0A285P6M5_9BACI|nr:N-acetylmuramoyl-L-alanine amidase [Terribacillus aidingensis]SNZ15786.1 N-acetylmuramoyl-L-alanine amidase [Terribacillus aidingensis]